MLPGIILHVGCHYYNRLLATLQTVIVNAALDNISPIAA